MQFFDSNGDPLNGGKIYTYAAGTTTPKATYTDNTEATPLSNPIILDSAGRTVAWGSGSYKFIVKDALENTIETTDNVTVFNVSSGNIIPVADAGGTVDAITANYTPDVGLTDKVLVSFVSAGPNTSSAPTFSPDGATPRTIVKAGGKTLAAGDIGSAGSVHMLQYNLANTRWELLNPIGQDVLTSTKTANYTATIFDDFIPCNASGGAFTITLYAASGNAGRKLTIKKTDSSLLAVTIDANASETIDGEATKRLSTQYETLVLECDGTNWFVVERHIPHWAASFTPGSSQGLGTLGSSTLKRERVGRFLKISGQQVLGTVTASEAQLAFGPASDPLVSATGASSLDLVGNAARAATNSALVLMKSAVNYMNFSAVAAAGGSNVAATGSAVFTNADVVIIDAMIPISGWEV